ncbi:MAG TPA: phosphatase PAP2 family protein [Terracidiphilus sp.]|nr:phosphatase PAP2 family protein [Terracidiphilus sp.]
MNPRRRTVLATVLLFCAVIFAQTPAVHHGQAAKTGYYAQSAPPNLSGIIPPPPEQNSDTTKAELAVLHQIERLRTPAQVAAAQKDDKEEDMFYLRTVMGKGFTPDDLPSLAALSERVVSEASAVSAALKGEFKRPRPYQFDRSLHPVCETVSQTNSYPSGHSIVGYLEAFTLIRIVPEKSREILERADDYAHNRMVCGVHYPSDIAASREVAYAVFGYLMARPRFQNDLAAARAETRKRLGLDESMAH